MIEREKSEFLGNERLLARCKMNRGVADQIRIMIGHRGPFLTLFVKSLNCQACDIPRIIEMMCSSSVMGGRQPLPGFRESLEQLVTEIRGCVVHGVETEFDYDSSFGICRRAVDGSALFIFDILLRYCGSEETYDIPDSVSRIDHHAFYRCDSLKEILIPSNVTEIGDYAFSGCSSLRNIVIPDSVTEIGDYAFSGCTSLEEVVIPDSVTAIGHAAFGSGPYTRLIDGPRDRPEFEGCKSLKSVTIHGSITLIQNCAFHDCSSLERIVIPETVTEIGDCAFSGCSSLKNIVIPDTVAEIGDCAFSGCPDLFIEVEDSNVSYRSCRGALFDKTGKILFSGQSLVLKDGSCKIPDSVTVVGECAFKGCSSLSEIVFGDSVTVIGREAFAGCSSLKQVIIPDSVTEIEYCAFSGCSSLEQVIIPDSVTSIHIGAFRGCSSLERIVIPDHLISILLFKARSFCSEPTYVVPYHTEIVSGNDGRVIRQKSRGYRGY